MKQLLLIFIFWSTLLADISVNTPTAWTTVRKNPLQIQLVADSLTVGKTIQFTLSQVSNTKSKVLKTIHLKVTDPNIAFEVSFPEGMEGGENFYSLSWKNDSGKVVSIAPLGFASLSPKPALISAIAGAVSNPTAFLDKNGMNVGDGRVAFGWTHEKLYVISKGTIQVGFDPANLKSSFVAFSHRFLTTKSDSKRPFYYYTRAAMNEKVDYKATPWLGSMKILHKEISIVEIPWYELGIKSFNNRILGIYVASDDVHYPENADKKMPASWGELVLK